MSARLAGPGDSVTWAICEGHEHDPRTEPVAYDSLSVEDAHEYLSDTFLDAVRSGIDTPLCRPGSAPGRAPLMVSSALTDWDRQGMALFLTACHHAVNHDRPEFVADALRKLVEMAAREYAGAYADELAHPTQLALGVRA